MEQLGAVQLGRKTDKRFLNGIIPDGWEEIVYEHDTFWACKCKRNDQVTSANHTEKDIEYNQVCNNIENEFREHLMEIYAITSAGVHFVVYLRKK